MFKLEPLPRNLEACRRDIAHKDVKVRLSVVSDLARGASQGDRSTRLELLSQALDDSSPEVRRRALVALADLTAKEMRDRVLALLRDPEISVRQMAVLCLGEIAHETDEEVVGRLASFLRAGDPAVRYQALIAHTELCKGEAQGDLERALRDEDGEVRELAVRLVDEVLVAQGAALSEALKKALVRAAVEDEAPGVRLVAELLCGELGLDAPREMVRRVVLRQVRVREPRDEQRALLLAGRLGFTDALPELKKRAFGRLGISLDPFRWSALAALCRLGDERAFEKLTAALRTRSPVDRTMALESLGESGRPEALSLLRALRDTGNLDPGVLAEAVKKLEAEVLGGNMRNSPDGSGVAGST